MIPPTLQTGSPSKCKHSALQRTMPRWALVVAWYALSTLAARPAIAQGPAFPSAEGRRYAQNETPAAWQFNQQPARQDAAPGGVWPRVAQQPQTVPAGTQPETPPQPPAPPANVAPEQSEKRAAQLKLIASQQDAANKRGEELADEVKQWEANIIKLRDEGLTDARPYSFLLLDKARDDVATELHSGDAIDDAITAAKEEVAQSKADKDAKEQSLHRVQEKLKQNSDAAAAPELNNALSEATHALEVANQTLKLHRTELANLKLDQHLQQLHLVYAQEKSRRYEQDVVFTPSMLNEVTSDLNAREKALTARNHEIEADLLKLLDDQRFRAAQRLDDAKASQDRAKLPALEAEVRAKNEARRTALLETQLNGEQLEIVQNLKEAWQRRYDLVNEAVPSADTTKWISETKSDLEDLRVHASEANTAIESIRKQLAALDRKLQSTDASEATLRYWLSESSKSLEQQRKLYEDMLVQMEPAGRVYEKLIDDLTSGDLTVTVSRWVAQFWQGIERIWQLELLRVGEGSDASYITVGKVVEAVFLLFLGIYASRLISRSLGRRMLSRMGFDASATAALQSVAFYILVVIFMLFALRLIRVPLTAFTVLGGALAIGIGFGSQNIVNNFISGLILLAERPVKVGDLIQLEQIYGNVEHIGARSTRVRTGENLEIIVPNSTFLETNVVNWTLSDNNMRTSVSFGVVYGSPLGKVTHLALKAAANHDRVFDRPEPFVTFNDFGDNALTFELHFWVAVRTLMERRKIESDIRFNLDHLYREAGIVIAFPQRDLHLFTERPLQVQMAPPPSASGDSDAA